MRSVLMPIRHQGPEFRSQFLRRSNNVALIVHHPRKTINCLLTARSLAAVSFTWLMPTQFHRSHHGIVDIVSRAPIPEGPKWAVQGHACKCKQPSA
jgi:hypothetical protein